MAEEGEFFSCCRVCKAQFTDIEALSEHQKKCDIFIRFMDETEDELFIDDLVFGEIERRRSLIPAAHRLTSSLRLEEDFEQIHDWVFVMDLASLTIQYSAMTKVDRYIGRLANLTTLRFQYNENLIELPPALRYLKKLTTLESSSSAIESIDRIRWADLVEIRELFLDGNQIETIPNSLVHLIHLKHLALDNNKIRIIPRVLFLLTSLCRLNLHNNQISMIRPEIGQLVGLEKLTLQNNLLTLIPETIGNLRNLKHLDLSRNQITVIPESLGTLPLLEFLDLRGNPIGRLPDSLLRHPNFSRFKIDPHLIPSSPPSSSSSSSSS